VRAVSSGAAVGAISVSGGGVAEAAAGRLCAQALVARSAPEISKRGMVGIGGQFTMLR